MGDHAHACQALLFQEVHLVDQGRHLRSFEPSRLFTLGSLELEESTHEGGEAGFMVLAVEDFSREDLENQNKGESVGQRRL
jgi:hypothetical protein